MIWFALIIYLMKGGEAKHQKIYIYNIIYYRRQLNANYNF